MTETQKMEHYGITSNTKKDVKEDIDMLQMISFFHLTDLFTWLYMVF